MDLLNCMDQSGAKYGKLILIFVGVSILWLWVEQLSMIILLSRRQNVWKVEDTMGCHPFYNISLSSFEYT